MRQKRRVETHRIFDQQDDLNAHRCYVGFYVHQVFEQFDDGEQQIAVAQPTEHIVDGAQVFVAQQFGHLTRKRRQQHHRQFRKILFDRFGVLKRVDALVVRHQNDKVERPLMQQACGGILAVGQRKARRITQIQRVVFVENLFVDATVLLQRKRVVVAGNKQYVVDTFVHQMSKRGVLEIEFPDVERVV